MKTRLIAGLIGILSIGILSSPARAQLAPTPPSSILGMCYNASAGWLPIRGIVNGQAAPNVPPQLGIFGQYISGPTTSYYGLACDANGNLLAGSFPSGSSLPATCSANPVQVYGLVTGGTTAPYYCSATNTWTAFGSGSGGGVSSFTGDGTVLSNSASTGAVTATLANATANSVFGNFTGTSGAPAYSATPTFSAVNLTNFPSTIPSATAGTLGCPAEYLNAISPAAIAAGCILLDANAFTGADAAAKLAACQTAAITLHVGCNMGALGGAQAITSGPMNCGNSSSNPILLNFPSPAIFTFNGTNLNGQPGMKIWTNCALYGPGKPGYTTASNTFANVVFAQGTAQLTAVIDTDATQAGGVAGGGKYMTVRGITAVNFSSQPTSSGRVWRIHNWQDATLLMDDGGASNTDAFIFDLNGFGSGAQGINNVANCNYDSYTLPTPGFTNGSAVIALASSTPLVDSTIVFANSGGALPTGFLTATPYYVIATGYTPGTSLEVSATPRGTAITAGSAGTGTQSAVMPCTPVLFENPTTGDSGNIATTWQGGSADHPGAYGNNMLATDTEAANIDTINYNGVYEESSTTNSTAPMNLISGVRTFSSSGVSEYTVLASGTATFIPFETSGAYNTALNMIGLTMIPGGSSNWTTNNTCVKNLFTGAPLLSDSNGNCGGWLGGNSFINNLNTGTLAVSTPSTATSGANFGSGATKLVTSYWNGSAAVAGGWNYQVNDATGTNPVETLAFTSLGASATNPVTFPGPLTAGSGITQGAGNTFTFNGRSRIASPADGELTLYNNAQTSYTRLQFGCTTSSCPAICVSGTTLQSCLADGTVAANIATTPGTQAFGIATLAAGTATVSNAAACTPSATCVYKLTNCGLNGSAAIGVPGVGTISVGTSFVINSYTAIAGVSADTSKVCWQIN